MESLKDAYRNAWETLIKPKKYHYDIFDLGEKEKTVKGQSIIREDFEVVNSQGFKIAGSFFYPKRYQKFTRGNQSIFDNFRNSLAKVDNLEKINGSDLPVVIYLHSHSGNRLEGLNLIELFCPNFGVCLFDFSGCGHSEGDYVTLGIKEQNDLIAVMDW